MLAEPSWLVDFWQILHCLDQLRKHLDEKSSGLDRGKQLDALRRALNELIEDGLGGMGLVAPGSVAGCFCFVLVYSKSFSTPVPPFNPLKMDLFSLEEMGL